MKTVTVTCQAFLIILAWSDDEHEVVLRIGSKQDTKIDEPQAITLIATRDMASTLADQRPPIRYYNEKTYSFMVTLSVALVWPLLV